MIRELTLALTASSSCILAEIDKSQIWDNDKVDSMARKWSEENVKQNGAAAQHEALALWRQKIISAGNLPREQAIEMLGTALRKTSDFNNFQVRERIAVYDSAQNAMHAIPGHAEHYRNKILQAQERYRNAQVENPGTTWSEYHNALGYGFQMFPHLHSPECVRVLGELMSNEWVPLGNENAPLSEKFVPLSISSRVALAKLPLVGKPFKDPITESNRDEALAAWRQWYDAIKAGKRTFRFEGDPTEYDLHGPAPGQKLAHISREQKRDAERDMGIHPVVDIPRNAQPLSATPTALLIAGMILLVVSVGCFILKVRNRSI